MGDRNRDQLFGLVGKRTVREHSLAKGLKCRVDVWTKAPPLLGEFARRFWISLIVHDTTPIDVMGFHSDRLSDCASVLKWMRRAV
jgi:hypothetical protein